MSEDMKQRDLEREPVVVEMKPKILPNTIADIKAFTQCASVINLALLIMDDDTIAISGIGNKNAM